MQPEIDVLADGDGRVDWTRLLPEPCRLLIVERMDSTDRAIWRLVNKQVCQDVYVATKQLTWPESSFNYEPLSLPSSLLCKLPSLQHLRCNDMHRLRYIDAVPHTLRSAHFHRCYKIQSLRPLQHCSMLEQLSLSGAYRHAEYVIMYLPAIMSALSACLRSLTIQLFTPPSLPSWHCADVDGKVLRALAPLARLQQLRLFLHHPSVQEWQDFACTLSLMTDLQLLDLSCTTDSRQIHHDGSIMAALVPAIGQLRQLRHLELSGRHLGFEGAACALAQAIAFLPAQLTTLSLESCHIGVDGGAALASALTAQSATLNVLQLGRNWLQAEGMVALAPGLRHCSALTELGLKYNLCGGLYGPMHSLVQGPLAETLSAIAPSLTSLDLSGALAGSAGAAAVAPALAAMTALTRLGYESNSLGHAGLQILASALQALPLQELLLLQNGTLGSDGALLLVSTLAGMTSMRRLMVSKEDVGGEGEALMQAAAARVPGLTVEFV